MLPMSVEDTSMMRVEVPGNWKIRTENLSLCWFVSFKSTHLLSLSSPVVSNQACRPTNVSNPTPETLNHPVVCPKDEN
jgi:hypothetical protein